MSENFNMNTTPVKGFSSSSLSGTPDQNRLESSLKKQKQTLENLRDINKLALEYKTKKENFIAQERINLEKEKQKTEEILHLLTQNCENTIKTMAKENSDSIERIKSSPLFAESQIKKVKCSMSSLKSGNIELRSQFSLSFKNFIGELNENRRIALEKGKSMFVNRNGRTIEEVNNHIQEIKEQISSRCYGLQKRISFIKCSVPLKLEISNDNETDDLVQSFINSGANEKSLCNISTQITEQHKFFFWHKEVAAWLSANSSWL